MLSLKNMVRVVSFKINFDIAIKDSFLAQFAVCRNSNGTILRALSQNSSTMTPILGRLLLSN